MDAPPNAAADRRLLYASVLLRALATGQMGVLLGLYLQGLRIPKGSADLIVGAGLAGAALAALIVTVLGSRLRKKGTLGLLAVLSAGGAVAALFAHDPLLIGLIAFGGMLNGMGRDRGAALIVEQALLPSTTDDPGRTRVFAVYNLLQDVGHALGALAAGLPSCLRALHGIDEMPAMRASLAACAGLHLLAGLAYLPLSSKLVAAPAVRAPVTPETRRVLWKISGLFALDSLGGGFLVTSMLTYFFIDRFNFSGGLVSGLFFAARILNALSHLGAAWLARRIGLVNTMVWTHVPSSLFLATVPFAPSPWIAVVLFLLREGLVEMDVPTRQSYVMAVVRPDERPVASGVTHLVRMAMWAGGAGLGGLFAGAGPLFVGAGLKIVYDVLLYVQFRHLKPPEEQSHGKD